MSSSPLDGKGSLNDLLGGLTASLSPAQVVGRAGGGAVTVTLEGMKRVSAVSISTELLEDGPMLEELVAAAINDALSQSRSSAGDMAQQLLGQLSGSFPARD